MQLDSLKSKDDDDTSSLAQIALRLGVLVDRTRMLETAAALGVALSVQAVTANSRKSSS